MAFRSAYQSCRPTRCCSAHASHLVWSGMGGAPHATQSPRDLALSLLSWVLRRFSSLRSGLSSYSRRFCSLASTSAGVGSTRGFGFFTFWLALADFLLDLGLFGVRMTKVLSKMRSLEPPACAGEPGILPWQANGTQVYPPPSCPAQRPQTAIGALCDDWKTLRRPPIYPNGAQAISPVAPSPPSAVLTPSIGGFRLRHPQGRRRESRRTNESPLCPAFPPSLTGRLRTRAQPAATASFGLLENEQLHGNCHRRGLN